MGRILGWIRRPLGPLGTRAQGPGPLGPGPGTNGPGPGPGTMQWTTEDQGPGPMDRAQGPGPLDHRAQGPGPMDRAQGPGPMVFSLEHTPRKSPHALFTRNRTEHYTLRVPVEESNTTEMRTGSDDDRLVACDKVFQTLFGQPNLVNFKNKMREPLLLSTIQLAVPLR